VMCMTRAVFFFSKGSYFYDRPNLLLLVIEPLLFINVNICGHFRVKKGNFAGIGRKKHSCGHISSIIQVCLALSLFV
jgi:hypothetical protein